MHSSTYREKAHSVTRFPLKDLPPQKRRAHKQDLGERVNDIVDHLCLTWGEDTPCANKILQEFLHR